MKYHHLQNTVLRHSAWLVLMAATAMSCSKSYTTEESYDEIANVSITTRATDNTVLEYPITLCTFDANSGALVSKKSIANAQDAVTISMVRDTNYKLVAFVANSAHYVVPNALTHSSKINVVGPGNEAYTTESALQMGRKDFTPTETSTSIQIDMAYAVASIKATVKELPDEVSAVNVTLSSPCTTVGMDGSISNPKTATIPLTKNTQSGDWEVSAAYMLPSKEGESATLAVSYTIGGVEHKASTVYESGFKAGTPYNFTATYDSKQIEVSGTIAAPSWGTEVSIPLTFEQDNGTNAGGGEGDGEGNKYEVDAIPGIGDIWDGHVVVAATGDDASATLLLLSKKRWDDVNPANAEGGTNVDEIIANYSEGDLSGWTLPTDAQATAIHDSNESNGSKLFAALNSVNADALNASSAKYLLGDANRHFTIETGTSSTTSSRSTYSVRLVKEVQVQKK